MHYSRRISISLTAAFLLIVFGMPLSQAALELARGERPHALELLLHVPTKANLRQFERELDNAAWAIRRSRPWMQLLQFTVLHHAGRDTLPGRNGSILGKPGSCGSGLHRPRRLSAPSRRRFRPSAVIFRTCIFRRAKLIPASRLRRLTKVRSIWG